MPAADLAIHSRRLVCLLVTYLMVMQPLLGRPAQQAPTKLNIVIVEGAGAINNIRQRTAREPIVQVVDENNRPVAGATVAFLLPGSGPGGTFPGGAHALTALTDQKGQAVAKGFVHNGEAGKFQIEVNASYQELTASTTINQANAVLTAAAAGGGGAGKIIAILAAVGGAAVAGVFVLGSKSNGGNGGAPPAPPATTITPGAPSVGGPP